MGNYTFQDDANSIDPYHIFYVSLYSILILMGIAGNLLTMITIALVKELHTNTYVFVFNLALIDLLLSAVVDFFSILGVLLGSQFFYQQFLLCKVIGGTCFALCMGSLTSILFLAANRYVNICMPKCYNRVFTKTKTIFYLVFIWIFASLNDLPHIFGWGGLIYDEKTESCIWNRLAHHSFNLFFGIVLIMTPCIVVLIFYLRIFRCVSNSLNNSRSANKSTLSRRELNKSFVVAKSLFISYIAFILCWVTYGLVVLFDYGDVLPGWVHSFAALMVHSYSSINPCLYFIFNPSLRNGYESIFYKVIRRRNHGNNNKKSDYVETDVRQMTNINLSNKNASETKF